MLASPLLVGALATGPAWVHLPLAVFWFVGYFAFFATSLWLKAGRRSRWWPPVRAYGLASAVLGAGLLLAQPELVRWVPAFVLPLGVGLWAAANRQDRELLAGLTTVTASGLITLVAYDAGPGEDWRRALVLALVQFGYFAGTVFYVKSVIRERDNERFARVSVGVHAAATAAAAVWSWWLGAVFALLTLRAALVPRMNLSPKQVGIGEVVATLVVALVSLAVT